MDGGLGSRRVGGGCAVHIESTVVHIYSSIPLTAHYTLMGMVRVLSLSTLEGLSYLYETHPLRRRG